MLSASKELRSLNKNAEYKEVISRYNKLSKWEKTYQVHQEYYRALQNESLSSTLEEKAPETVHLILGDNVDQNSAKDKAKQDILLRYNGYKTENSSKPLTFNDRMQMRTPKPSELIQIALSLLILYKFYQLNNFFTLEKNDSFKIEKTSPVRFSDVKGIDEYKQEVEDLVDYLKNPQKYIQAGVKAPKGILLTGKPGTGKTLLAKAIAGEAGVSFLHTSGSSFEEKYVGVGPSRVRKIFEEARKLAPCIIFIDEIDSVAQSRNYRAANYSKDSLNQLLVEMDGFKPSDNIIVMGATNFLESIDKALLRSGRFDKIIELPVPDRQARSEIIDFYLGKIKTHTSLNKSVLVSKTLGMTGADIENLVNIAALHAVKAGKPLTDWDDFDYAIDRVTMGISNKSLMVDKSDIETTVYHELGHAVVAYYTQGANEMQKITILPRGQSLGHTAFVIRREDKPISKEQILAHLDVCMGGRAAEELFFGQENITTGFAGDLKSATNVIYYGLRTGLFAELTGQKSFSDLEEMGIQQRNDLDSLVIDILNKAYLRAAQIIREKTDLIHGLAEELREKETLTKDEFVAIVDRIR